ncbi:MAG: hypothetical protein QME52_12655, partial [Bacteroidota bacterium]|nr:hypothetical protein [Bacteroidota bacterium]
MKIGVENSGYAMRLCSAPILLVMLTFFWSASKHSQLRIAPFRFRPETCLNDGFAVISFSVVNPGFMNADVTQNDKILIRITVNGDA